MVAGGGVGVGADVKFWTFAGLPKFKGSQGPQGYQNRTSANKGGGGESKVWSFHEIVIIECHLIIENLRFS